MNSVQVHLFLIIFTMGTLSLGFPNMAYGQQDTAVWAIPLEEVEISAYAGSSLMTTPASIAVIDQKSLDRYNAGNMLPAMNTMAGVQMDERSPGSYRLNIRGSSVRSPYGVRNVKIYYGDIPFTSPGGVSMLNMLGNQQISGFEVIKSPGNSLYGSGTGGVLLLKPPVPSAQTTLSAAYTQGSYRRHMGHVAAQVGHHHVGYEHLQSDGYRHHAGIRRDVGVWTGTLWQRDSGQLTGYLLLSDLYYDTPGALTQLEYTANPRAARPATAVFPGAEMADASIRQQGGLFGLTWKSAVGSRWYNTTSVYGFANRTTNPTIQNVEFKHEPHVGARSTFRHTVFDGFSRLHLTTGIEWQGGISRFQNYGNRGGAPDRLISKDRLLLNIYFGFGQLNWEVGSWHLTIGSSINGAGFRHRRTEPIAGPEEADSYHAVVSPRFGTLYQITKSHSVYVNIARGFAPPASSEFFADDGVFNAGLRPEICWAYEAGFRGRLFTKQLTYDVNLFRKDLNNTIVTRRDAGGGNFFVNAGHGEQVGLEMDVRYRLSVNASSAWNNSGLGFSYSLNHFKYRDFVQGATDYSNNTMPGTSPNTAVFLLDVNHRAGWSVTFTGSYMAGFPLNDANSIYSEAALVCDARANYAFSKNKAGIHIFFGVDNIGNTAYSLGYDINGFGGRYFNAAPTRNFFAGFALKWHK